MWQINFRQNIEKVLEPLYSVIYLRSSFGGARKSSFKLTDYFEWFEKKLIEQLLTVNLAC